MKAELEAIGSRLDRVAMAPEEVATGFWKLMAPVLRAVDWKPEIQTKHLSRLVVALEAAEAGVLLRRAIAELDSNVSVLEQQCIVRGRAIPSLVTWMYRFYVVLKRAQDLAELGVRIEPPDTAFLAPQLAGANETVRLPPLARTIDPLLAAARSESLTLDRKRKLLEAAREALLECGAAAELDEEAVARRRAHVIEQLALIDRLEAAGVAPRISLIHQARTAASRGESQRLLAVLTALDGAARSAHDLELSRLTAAALGHLWNGQDRLGEAARRASLRRSGQEVFSDEVRDAVKRGTEKGRQYAVAHAADPDPKVRARAAAARKQFEAGAEEALILVGLHVNAGFEVGGTLSPQRVVQEHRRVRHVEFPTQDLALLPARTVADIPSAIIEDPRRILHDLATGRLLSRRYMVEEVHRTERTVMRGEVRAYLLDGSGSMHGQRARMRDSLLVAELSTLIARYADPLRRVEPVLFYRYFNHEQGSVHRVADPGAAIAAIEEVTSTLRVGGTNIRGALLATLTDIQEARERDPSLARAQIVLVTDGNAPVDHGEILQARAALGTLPVGISIIALGAENPALRELAASQRARGEAVFYHFVPDDELQAIESGQRALVALHLPGAETTTPVGKELAALVEDMASLGRVREDAHAGESAGRMLAAFDEVGLSAMDPAHAALEARAALARRDQEAVERHFDGWFPEPRLGSEASPREAVPPPDDAELLHGIDAILRSTADVVDLVGSTAAERRLDAVELAERLLYEALVPPWRYAQLLRRYPGSLDHAISRVRDAVEGGGVTAPSPYAVHPDQHGASR